MSRDREVERRVLDALVRDAKRWYGVDCGPYVGAVLARLELGATRYGDDAFLERDNVRELLEETADLAGYALLETERLRAAGTIDMDVLDLMNVALLGAVADHHARRILARRGGR